MTTDYINLLNAGSGLNTKQIIDSLVEAERTPVEELITKNTEEIEVSILALELSNKSSRISKQTSHHLMVLLD